MKVLLTLLMEKINPPWWRLRSGEGNPPEEREGHYILSALLAIVRAKINRAKEEDEDNP
jgi:hypothetical protein